MVDLFRGGGDLIEIFKKDEFTKGENEIQEFWKVLINSARELNAERTESSINYLLESLPNHSCVAAVEAGIGIRPHLSRYLAVLLDRAGWSDTRGGRVNNSDDKVIGIADWIFGSERKASILDRLMLVERGVLGIYDVLLFRLQCSADRDGGLFNLTRALGLHSLPPSPITGDTKEIAIGGLRELSQKIFATFKKQYISTRINFFEKVDNLKLNELTGSSSDLLLELGKKENWGNEKLDQLLGGTKSLIKSFCVYQLGNSLVSSGVGCGYYDEKGVENGGGIKSVMSNYLFEVCFDEDNGGFVYFLDYLLLCFDMTFEIQEDGSGFEFRPTLDQFLRVLDKDQLRHYWLVNRADIINLNFDREKKYIYNSNYHTSYAEGLPQVYQILDELTGVGKAEISVPEIYG